MCESFPGVSRGTICLSNTNYHRFSQNMWESLPGVSLVTFSFLNMLPLKLKQTWLIKTKIYTMMVWLFWQRLKTVTYTQRVYLCVPFSSVCSFCFFFFYKVDTWNVFFPNAIGFGEVKCLCWSGTFFSLETVCFLMTPCTLRSWTGLHSLVAVLRLIQLL